MLTFNKVPQLIRNQIFGQLSAADLYRNLSWKFPRDEKVDQYRREALVKFFEKRGAEAYDYQDRLIESWIVYFNKNKTLPLMSNEEDKRFWLGCLNNNILNNPEAPLCLKLRVSLLISKLLPSSNLTIVIEQVLTHLLEEMNNNDSVGEVLKAFRTEISPAKINEIVEKFAYELLRDSASGYNKKNSSSVLIALLPRLPAELSEALFDRFISLMVSPDSDRRAGSLRILSSLCTSCPPKKLASILEGFHQAFDDEYFFGLALTGLGRLAPHIPQPVLDRLSTKILNELGSDKRRTQDRANQAFVWLSRYIPQEQINETVVQAVTNLTSESWVARMGAADTLAGLSSRVLPCHVTLILDALIIVLNDQDQEVRSAAIDTLAAFSSRMSKDLIDRVADLISSDLYLSLPITRESVFKAYAVFAPDLKSNIIRIIDDWFIDTFANHQYRIGKVVIKLLVALAHSHPAERLTKTFDYLLKTLDSHHYLARDAAYIGLCGLMTYLSQDEMAHLVDSLVLLLPHPSYHNRENSALLLGKLITKIPAERWGASINGLRGALGDHDDLVRQVAGEGLAVAFPYLNTTELEGFSLISGNSQCTAFQILAQSRLHLIRLLSEPNPEPEKPGYMCNSN